MGFFSKVVKRLDYVDIGLIKISVAAFVLFLITIWSAAMNWVNSVNTWYFFVAFIVFAARPLYRAYIK